MTMKIANISAKIENDALLFENIYLAQHIQCNCLLVIVITLILTMKIEVTTGPLHFFM